MLYSSALNVTNISDITLLYCLEVRQSFDNVCFNPQKYEHCLHIYKFNVFMLFREIIVEGLF